MSTVIPSITAEFRRYKALGEGAIAQVDEPVLSRPLTDESNSIAVIVWHLGGNLRSRFSDFQTTDGEKPWRNRDEEFVERTASRQELLEKWNSGWDTLLAALGALTDDNLQDRITIRGQPYTILDALLRSLAHVSYHVGQIVFAAKAARGGEWQTLSIPKGGSAAYNLNPRRETADAHAAALRERAKSKVP